MSWSTPPLLSMTRQGGVALEQGEPGNPDYPLTLASKPHPFVSRQWWCLGSVPNQGYHGDDEGPRVLRTTLHGVWLSEDRTWPSQTANE